MFYGLQKVIYGAWAVKHALCTANHLHCITNFVLGTKEHICESSNIRDVVWWLLQHYALKSCFFIV